MDRLEFERIWRSHAEEGDEYLKFARVEPKRSSRPDLNGFILLNELVPGTLDIVSVSEHDEIFLDIDLEQLALVITEAHIIELIRSGIILDCGVNSQALYV